MTVPTYLPAPPPAAGLTRIGVSGIAEIKPHHKAGILKGLQQLTARGGTKAGRPRLRVLITYLPVGATDAKPKPSSVRVFATHFSDQQPGEKGPAWVNRILGQPWRDLGKVPALPASVPVDLADPVIFGRAIEGQVRDLFVSGALAAKQRGTARPMAGKPSPHRGVDVSWELAEMYRELGRTLRDPFYLELAEELSGMASGGRVSWAA